MSWVGMLTRPARTDFSPAGRAITIGKIEFRARSGSRLWASGFGPERAYKQRAAFRKGSGPFYFLAKSLKPRADHFLRARTPFFSGARGSFGGVISGSGDSAGPPITSPLVLNREPWHGQSQVHSVSFQCT